MEEFLSKDELESYLYKLRTTLCTYNYESLSNVIFFNNDVVFEYLCTIPLISSSEMTVGDCLEVISPCIPVSLNDHSLRFIMQSANSPEMINTLEVEYSKKNKMDFMQIITQITSQNEWKNIVGLCETIRSFRINEQTAVLT